MSGENDMYQNVAETIEENLLCPVCKTVCDSSARGLTCQHFVCLGCAENLLLHGPELYDTEENVLQCPVCRQIMYVEDKDVATLPPAFQLQALREIKEIIKPKTNEGKPSIEIPHCDKCTQGAAQYAQNECIDCDSLYCETCTEEHGQYSGFESHEVRPVVIEYDIMCTLHPKDKPRKPAVMLCQSCWEPVCSPCLIRDHKKHKTEHISKILIQQINALHTLKLSLEDGISNCEKHRCKIKEFVNDSKTHLQSQQTYVQETEKNAIDWINTSANEIMQELHDNFQGMELSLQSSDESLANCMLKKKIKLVEAVGKLHGAPVDVLKLDSHLLREEESINIQAGEFSNLQFPTFRSNLVNQLQLSGFGKIESGECSTALNAAKFPSPPQTNSGVRRMSNSERGRNRESMVASDEIQFENSFVEDEMIYEERPYRPIPIPLHNQSPYFLPPAFLSQPPLASRSPRSLEAAVRDPPVDLEEDPYGTETYEDTAEVISRTRNLSGMAGLLGSLPRLLPNHAPRPAVPTFSDPPQRPSSPWLASAREPIIDLQTLDYPRRRYTENDVEKVTTLKPGLNIEIRDFKLCRENQYIIMTTNSKDKPIIQLSITNRSYDIYGEAPLMIERGHVNDPWGVAVNEGNDIILADNQKAIEIFNSEGRHKQQLKLPEFHRVFSIAWCENSKLVAMSDWDERVVLTVDPRCNRVVSYFDDGFRDDATKHGMVFGRFHWWPTYLSSGTCGSQDMISVVDEANNMIKLFDVRGNLIKQLSHDMISHPGRVYSDWAPNCSAVDGCGGVWLMDPKNHLVSRFSGKDYSEWHKIIRIGAMSGKNWNVIDVRDDLIAFDATNVYNDNKVDVFRLKPGASRRLPPAPRRTSPQPVPLPRGDRGLLPNRSQNPATGFRPRPPPPSPPSLTRLRPRLPPPRGSHSNPLSHRDRNVRLPLPPIPTPDEFDDEDVYSFDAGL